MNSEKRRPPRQPDQLDATAFYFAFIFLSAPESRTTFAKIINAIGKNYSHTVPGNNSLIPTDINSFCTIGFGEHTLMKQSSTDRTI